MLVQSFHFFPLIFVLVVVLFTGCFYKTDDCFNQFKELFKKVFKTKYIFKIIKFVDSTAYSIIFGSIGWPCFIYFGRVLLSNMEKTKRFS